MPSDPSTFDELGFKQMVRRAWGGDCCPHALRERLMATAAEPVAAEDAPLASIRPRGVQWQRWALAAAVLLAAMLPAVRHALRTVPHSAPLQAVASTGSGVQPEQPSAVVPVSLAEELVSTHERCSHKVDHHGLTVAAADDDTAIATAMRTQLSRAVLVARPADQQWHFRGAAICRVGTIPCGHLVFAKGEDAISVFSLPASADPNLRDGDEISTVAGGHPIAGFAKDGAIFYLVASSSGTGVTVADLRQMRDRMESAVTSPPSPAAPAAAATTSDAPPEAVAELLQPLIH